MLTAGKVVVALAKRASGFKRKTLWPMVVSIGGGISQIVNHPVVEYFPPDVTACLAYLKRHCPEFWCQSATLRSAVKTRSRITSAAMMTTTTTPPLLSGC